MKVNYVLMYGTPYLRYREFETFEDVSKFLVNKSIVNYSIFKKLEDKEEVEMIYRDNDIRYLEQENKQLKEQLENDIDLYEDTISYQLGFDKGKEYLQQKIDKAIECIKKDTRWFDYEYAKTYGELCTCEGANSNRLEVMVNPSNLLEILGDKEND